MTTDKEQIIIDGVDVSTCKGLKYDGTKKPICLVGGVRGIYRSCLCEKNQNCLFKQLARKTQWCEELKGRLEYIRQENKNLKDSATAEQIDYVSLKNYISTLEFTENRYRDALKEIKEIAKINCEEICGRKFGGCNDFLCPSKNIIDIINKAKGEE